MIIAEKTIGPHTIIEVNGFLNKKNVSILSDALFGYIQKEHKSIILDLRNLNYMDSAGLGVFIACKKEMDSRNGLFAILSPNKNVLFLLQLVALDDFFTIYEDENALPAQ